MTASHTNLAKDLRASLKQEGIRLSHRQALNMIAKVKGFSTWEDFKSSEDSRTATALDESVVDWSQVADAQITSLKVLGSDKHCSMFIVNKPGLRLLGKDGAALERLGRGHEFAFKVFASDNHEAQPLSEFTLAELQGAKEVTPGLIELASGKTLQLFTSPEKKSFEVYQLSAETTSALAF